MGKCREEAGMSGRYRWHGIDRCTAELRTPDGRQLYTGDGPRFIEERDAEDILTDELNALLARAEKAEKALNEAIARGMAAETRSVTLKTLLGALRSMLEDQHHRAEKAEARVAELEREVAAWSPARHYGEEKETRASDCPIHGPEHTVPSRWTNGPLAPVRFICMKCSWVWEDPGTAKTAPQTPVLAPEGTGYPTGAADHNEVHEHHVAVYGGTRIPVAKCPECKVESFVEGGLSACCSVPIDEAVSGVRRYTRGGHRGKPNYKFQREQLDRQNHRCFWCDRAFGDPYVRAGRGKGGLKFLRVAWDHVIPIAVDGTNHEDNFVASCNVCNGFKGAKIFANETAMRAWLKSRWLAKMIPDWEVDREG